MDSLNQREELFFATAAVSAHAQGRSDGFRQRDVKFLIELFSNWLEPATQQRSLPIHNLQVSRYLKNLVNQGYARSSTVRGSPKYHLSRTGLIELLSRVVHKTYVDKKEQFFFLLYFIRNHRPRLEKLVREEGREFPHALQVELESLLNEELLLSRELEHARKELSKLDYLVAQSKRVGIRAEELSRQGTPEEIIISEIERLHPYALHSQKPLSELMASLDPDLKAWEIRYGYKKRGEDIFLPTREMLFAYVNTIERLQKKI